MPTLLELAGVDGTLVPEMEGFSLQWRWNQELDYPEQVRSAALSEAGGALNADNVNFLVSGRDRSKYCYNGPRYSMCFDPKDKSRRVPSIHPQGDGDGEDDGDDDHGHEDPFVVDAAPTGAVSVEFFDRETDPKLTMPLADVPDDVREALMGARGRWSPESTRARAVRTVDYKLVAYPQLEGGYRYAMYDLREDPSESKDVSAQRPKDFKRMKKMFDEYESTMSSFVARERSDKEIEELLALGYIQ